MSAESIRARFHELPDATESDRLEASELEAGSGIWIARDTAHRPHLLVRVPEDTRTNYESTRGLGVQVSKHEVQNAVANYVDLHCTDTDGVDPFFVLADEVGRALAALPDEGRPDAVRQAMADWRWFWGVDSARLSGPDAVGLFGELWFLIRWAGVSPENVAAWDASSGARHDFQWRNRSVEVKTTSTAGAVVHHIQHLEQLADPETGELFLFSLRIVTDKLAANSLASLADVALDSLSSHPVARAEFVQKLASRGYTPTAAEHTKGRYRVLGEALYRVSSDFPRLVRDSFEAGLPGAIVAVSYDLDMGACDPWLVSTDADAWRDEAGNQRP